jgi:uncharacterized protein (DUF1697 family)
MQDLREIVASLGFTDVTTYIQSGNVLFTATDGDPATLAASIEQAIADRLGLNPGVAVVSRRELAAVVRANPFTAERDAKRVHAIFLASKPGTSFGADVAAAQQRAAAKGSRDSAHVVGRVIYLHTPDGFGRSELAVLLGRLTAGGAGRVSGTARNWATVTKLLELLGT